MRLITWTWWKAALIRAARTAGVIATPYVATVFYTTGDWLLALSAAGFGALGSIVTSLIQIPTEAQGVKVAWWYSIFERSVKTIAQALVTVFGTASMFEQVDWSQAPALIATALVGTWLLAGLGFLPETEGKVPMAAPQVPTTVVNEAGEAEQAAIPVVAAVEAQAEQAPAYDPEHPDPGAGR
jgi:hypothetical protein